MRLNKSNVLMQITRRRLCEMSRFASSNFLEINISGNELAAWYIALHKYKKWSLLTVKMVYLKHVRSERNAQRNGQRSSSTRRNWQLTA